MSPVSFFTTFVHSISHNPPPPPPHLLSIGLTSGGLVAVALLLFFVYRMRGNRTLLAVGAVSIVAGAFERVTGALGLSDVSSSPMAWLLENWATVASECRVCNPELTSYFAGCAPAASADS